ncbi:MAG: hypothetical protein M1817_001707 [Caeruleum heppii]|nr:MAG: hypothetical protein M1817_001707 [Caeruleum heppii]
MDALKVFVSFGLALPFLGTSLVLLPVLYYTVVALYNIYLHPLRHVPGPKLAAATDLWLVQKSLALKKCPTIHETLNKYGPLVRVAPNKLVVGSQEGIKTIYPIGSKFLKSDWYHTWGLAGFQNVFSTIDPKDHAIRRAITARTFSKNAVLQFLPDIMSHVHGMVRLLDGFAKEIEEGSRASVDLVKIYRYMALDILGSTLFGEDFDLIKTGREHPFVLDLNGCIATIPVRGYLPSWLWRIVSKIPNKQWQFHLGGERRLCDYAAVTAEKVLSRPKTAGSLPTTISAYDAYRDKQGNGLSRERIIGEIAAMYFAGTDTTSTIISFLTFEIARRPDIQSNLFAELKERIPDPDTFPDYAEVETFPYLDCVVQEGLRVYATIPSHLERVVPAGGTKLHGYDIPAGTVVGTQAYSLHRNEEVFPRSHHFDPDRWLHATPEMKKSLSPWGFGSRICMGMHLSYIEMRLILAAQIRNFSVSLPENFDQGEMDMKDFWLIFPKGGTLPMVVKARED